MEEPAEIVELRAAAKAVAQAKAVLDRAEANLSAVHESAPAGVSLTDRVIAMKREVSFGTDEQRTAWRDYLHAEVEYHEAEDARSPRLPTR
ncbi:MAG: hypothetical protein EXR65_05000 [Dehalococcoidia bacterium]|nr:hypothetical protein [Dehalococcoidia bacterium]